MLLLPAKNTKLVVQEKYARCWFKCMLLIELMYTLHLSSFLPHEALGTSQLYCWPNKSVSNYWAKLSSNNHPPSYLGNYNFISDFSSRNTWEIILKLFQSFAGHSTMTVSCMPFSFLNSCFHSTTSSSAPQYSSPLSLLMKGKF